MKRWNCGSRQPGVAISGTGSEFVVTNRLATVLAQTWTNQYET